MTAEPDRILVVEDERAQRDGLVRFLAREGYAVDGVGTGEEALELVARRPCAVLITDLRLPGIDGLTVLRRSRELDGELGVLLVTAFASVESAVEALRQGAWDYLLKPLLLPDVARKVGNLLAYRDLLRENARLRRALHGDGPAPDLVARSAAMQEVTGWVRRAAGSDATVLVTGETGTGKEVVARAIHRAGPRAESPFLAVNIAAIPETMVESELFGHEKGAFTGADHRREGILRAAGPGTVFVDEVAELSPTAQAKLLRALEAREVQPLGRDTAARFEARIVAATHQELADRVAAGRFREDLYYRLNVLHIHVPPLRERREDIPALVHHLLRRHAGRGGAPPPTVTAEAMRALCQHAWRGNVRELSNVLERALILADAGRITPDELPADVVRATPGTLALEPAVVRFERSHIALVLRLHDGNREAAARDLGVSPATLFRRIERLGLKGFEVHRGGDARDREPPSHSGPSS